MSDLKPVAVLGAGAIGGYLAGKLGAAGHPVSVAARGAHGRALAEVGLILDERGVGRSPPVAVEVLAPDRQGRREFALAIVAGKAHQLRDLCTQNLETLERSERILFIQNGFPWWYFQGDEQNPAAESIWRLDPDKWLRTNLPGRPLFAALAFKAGEVTEPGVVSHYVASTDRFPVGAVVDGTPGAPEIVELLTRSGIPAEASGDIRREIWMKLMGNVSVNPLCALTRRTVGDLATIPETMEIVASLIDETIALAARFGHDVSDQREWRLQRMRTVGGARPSMLQDLEAGREMEIDAIIAVMTDLADRSGLQVPTMRTIYGALLALASSKT